MIDESRLEPTSEPHHQQKRRPVPTPLLLPGHGATPTRPRQDRNQNTTPHHRRSLVPSERRQHRQVDSLIRRSRRTTSGSAGSGADTSTRWASPTHRAHIEPPRSIETLHSPFRENANRPIRSFKHDGSRRSSLRLNPACPHWAAGPTSRPANLGTPPTPDHAVTPKRAPHFVPP